MKVYLLSTGCYSDYSVVGVCSSKEKAEEIMSRFKGGWDGWNDIEEMELDALHKPEGVRPIRVWMEMDGSSEVEECDVTYFKEESAFLKNTHDKKPRIRVDRWAKSPEDVVKIANEFRIKCKLEHGL